MLISARSASFSCDRPSARRSCRNLRPSITVIHRFAGPVLPLWQRAEMVEALRRRDIGRVFQLLRQYAGISQTRLAIACDMTQPKVSGIMRGTAKVESLEVFERIADGLSMPDPARLALGLAPKAVQSVADSTAARRPERADLDSPSRNTRSALTAPMVSDLLGGQPRDGEGKGESCRGQHPAQDRRSRSRLAGGRPQYAGRPCRPRSGHRRLKRTHRHARHDE
jgi:transcriptional regulator with XRE-family HTH domain